MTSTAVPGAGVWAIVVAAGSGTRFGARKQFSDLAGTTLLDRAVSAAASRAEGVVVVLPDADEAEPATAAGVDLRIVKGAATRSGSVRCGLAAVPSAAEIVAVHDAARPLASPELFDSVIAAVRGGADAAVPAVGLADTIRLRGGGTIDRDKLAAVQTPQAFAAVALRQAHAAGGEATDDAALVESAGGKVVLVDGDRRNVKITAPGDLAIAEALLQEAPTGIGGPPFRVGMGFDVHARSDDPERRLVLGGVRFDSEPGLVAHSDGDVVAHACAEALLGAAGLGDIGEMFADTDPALEGADSMELLRLVATAVLSAGWRPGNVDCSVVTDSPRIALVKARMQHGLSAAVGAPVTVSGRRSEGIGAVGRGEGVAAWAVALVWR